MVTEVHQTELLRWIVLLPLLAAVAHGLLLGLVRRPLPRVGTVALSCGSVGVSFVLSFVALIQLTGLAPEDRFLVDELYTWIGAGRFSAEAALLLDPLSAVMILVVTGVGLLIHVYSVGYMDGDDREDKGFQRFFCYLNLFLFAMLVLVLADNLVLLFLGWEGVGLCSYLLIGFWYADHGNARAGAKAFVVNRIGDFGFLVGIFLLFWAMSDAGQGSLSFQDLRESMPAIAERSVALPSWLGWLPGAPEWRLTSLIGLCFFVGAVGKSAQIPLYVWLPDAMAGPTPVSALIHAATMVTAGIYMVCRLSFLYEAAPGASMLIAWTGGATALLAATMAIAQSDIKKVLAYSTISQLGYMFMAAGLGAYTAAIFHVVMHAFFKALLFLAAGSVVLALHHEQDTDRMGGLRRLMPWTHRTFLIGVLAISGAPYFSGFFSKDAILLAEFASDTPGHQLLYVVGLLTAGLTAFYMFRLYFRTFYGEFRGTDTLRRGVKESSSTILVPLFVLAFLSVFGGLLLGPPAAFVAFIPIEDPDSFGRFLAPVLDRPDYHIPHAKELALAALATAVAAAGALLAWLLYVRQPGLAVRVRTAIAPVHRWVEARYYVDEAYQAAIVRPLIALSDRVLYRTIDAGWIDRGLVEGSARAVRGLASGVFRHLQTGLAQSYLAMMIVGTLAIVAWLLR